MKQIETELRLMTSMSQVLDHFDIPHDPAFARDYGHELLRRFNGNILIRKPEDWFDYRRCLKNAYCRIQRGRLPKAHRKACNGCTSCERR